MAINEIDKLHLNKAQRQAVEYRGKPLLIIAGAGTGKTTVVTERIKHLIATNQAKPQEIVALTFTEKAAKEMEDRVDRAMPYGYTQMWISTFHSFADRILRVEALHIGLDPDFKLATAAEAIHLLRSNMFDFNLEYFLPLTNPNKFLAGMISHFSRLQDEAITPQDYCKWVDSQSFKTTEEELEVKKWKELAHVYKKYDELKIQNGFLDFGDLIIKTLDLFKKRPNVLARYKDQFKHILVDEFQDTNIAQYELIKLLAPPSKKASLTVVADDNQSIYKFRGAAISNILYFKEDYPDCKSVVLNENYRSKQEILDASYALIKRNDPDTLEARLGISKKLKSKRVPQRGGQVNFIHSNRVENEAEEVAQEILKLHTKKNYSFGDIAILVRANSHADPFLQALHQNGVPYQFLGPSSLFKQNEVVELISYLKALYNFEDSLSLLRVLSMRHFSIPARDLSTLNNFAKKNYLSLHEAAEKHEELPISKAGKETIKKVLELILLHLEKVNQLGAGRILYDFLNQTGILSDLASKGTGEDEKAVKNISKFFDKLKNYEMNHPNARFEEVIDWIELVGELGESSLSSDADWQQEDVVNILTVHGSKGLEFPVVFMVNLVGERFPTRNQSDQLPIPTELIKEKLPEGDFHIQEERRLFYVGMTRAMDHLYFTAADYYSEAKRQKKISPFVYEALGNVIEKKSKHAAEQLGLLSHSPYFSQNVSLSEEGQKQSLTVEYLSHTRMETFEICPLHYKLRYILGVPTFPTAAQSFGTSIHSAMKALYTLAPKSKLVAKRKIGSLLSEHWLKTGYSNKSHERKAFRQAVEFINAYVKQEYDSNHLPILQEATFSVPLKRKGEKPLSVGGVMDRVDSLESGRIEIIDYKTGNKIPSQKEVDSNMQLSIYALAASQIPNPPFNKKPDEILLSLYFFEEQKKITTRRTKKQLKDTCDKIFSLRKDIEQSDFKCSHGYICQNGCEYSMFCSSKDNI